MPVVVLGVDWGEHHHDLCVLDQDGSVLATRRIADGLAGMGARVLGEFGDDPNRHTGRPALLRRSPAPWRHPSPDPASEGHHRAPDRHGYARKTPLRSEPNSAKVPSVSPLPLKLKPSSDPENDPVERAVAKRPRAASVRVAAWPARRRRVVSMRASTRALARVKSARLRMPSAQASRYRSAWSSPAAAASVVHQKLHA
jgi:hypothetical protein